MTHSQLGEVLQELSKNNMENLRYLDACYDLRTQHIWLVKLSHGADTIIFSTMQQYQSPYDSLHKWIMDFLTGKWQLEDKYISTHNAKMYTGEVIDLLRTYKNKVKPETTATELLESILVDLEKRQL